MAATYPGTIQTFQSLSGTAKLSSPDHTTEHTLERDNIVAVETVMGTTTGTAVLKDITLGKFAVSNNGGTLNNAIVGTPAIAGGTVSGAVVSGVTISSGTINTVTMGTPSITGGTLNSPIITGTGGTTAGMYGYDATDKGIFIGDGTTKQEIFISAWKSYVPTYSGNGSMTYGTVTTTYAKYTVIGRLVIVTIYATGTVGGTPNNRLTATLPLTAATSVNAGLGGGWTSDGGGGFTAMVILDSSTTVGIQRYDASAYTAGSGRVISITFSYEI